jgi:hypothetical protein
MAEEQHDNAKLSDTEGAASRPDVDWYLQQMVKMANEQGVEMGVTLVVGGSVITGTMVSGATYFETFAEQFASGWTDEESKGTIQKALAQPAQLYAHGKNNDPLGASFIHLRDARIITPSEAMPTQGMLWRGRLTEVSGFSLGTWAHN